MRAYPLQTMLIFKMTSIFHKFIEVSAIRPPIATTIPEFVYMQHDIRKLYHQFKDNKGIMRPNKQFITFWEQIGKQGKQEQVALYFQWIELLQKAIDGQVAMKGHKERQAWMYVRKSTVMGKWQRKRIKIDGLILRTYSKHIRDYPLKCFGIRKSKNKQHFSLVLQVIMHAGEQKLRSFHIGSNNIIQFQQWYQDLQNRINLARIIHFRDSLGIHSPKDVQKEEKPPQTSQARNTNRIKTLTELVIDKELEGIEQFEEFTVIEESQLFEVKEEELHPHVFKRLYPQKDLSAFNTLPASSFRLQENKHFSLYEVDGQLKAFMRLAHPIESVFRAISESHTLWNSQIDLFTVKNKISSENSILAYQKDKSKGFLYRERDYLFLRHCFSLGEVNGLQGLFMVEKSIDSIHTPPFMTVFRGEKELIWALVGKEGEKECQLVVEGFVKGGGFMAHSEDRQNTIKFMKKIPVALDGYLSKATFKDEETLLFKRRWVVNLKEEEDEEEFYSPRQMASDQDQAQLPGHTSLASGLKKSEKQAEGEEEFKKSYTEFIKHTTEEHFDAVLEQEETVRSNMGSEDLAQAYIPPLFNQNSEVVINGDYLRKLLEIDIRSKGRPKWGNIIRGHHLWKGEWAVAEGGGLNYVDQEKMREQKKVLTFIIRRIGKNLLSGKGILNISLPVDIFCRQSNIERLAMSFGYCPVFLEPVAHQKDPIKQLKAVLAASCGSSLIYLTMEKPFNPILGETYQGWIDGCPVYFEQISHHPPVAAYYLKGRGYTVSGTVEAKMDISINSGTGINQGIFTVKFDNGRTFYYTTPPGQLNGLTYGERKLILVDKTYFWNVQEGLFLEITYNPLAKQRGFFGVGGKNLVGEERLADFCEGTLKKYTPVELQEFLTPKKGDNRKLMAIPRSYPSVQSSVDLGKVRGRWSKEIRFDGQKIFDVDQDNFLMCFDDKYPLPSHANYREDIVYRRLGNVVTSQEFKETLEVRQRKDRKLREDFKKKNR